MSEHKITLQIPASMADGSIWLYERTELLDFVPGVGHMFMGTWIPAVIPPDKGPARNVARVVIYDFDTKEHLVQLHGFRDGSRNAEETDAEMKGWKRHPTPLKKADVGLPIAPEG